MKIGKNDKKWYNEFFKKINVKTKTSKLIDMFSDFLEIPDEVVSNLTKITMIENKSLLIEGYKQIIDYYDNYIKIKAYNTNIVVDGNRLDIKEITDSELIIQGEIYSINYK